MINIPLFKNLEEKYRDAFKNYGQVRLSPLSDFRKKEYGSKYDELEGLIRLSFQAKESIKSPSEEFNIPGSNVSINGGYIKIDPGSKVDMVTTLTDVYTLCVTENPQSHLGEANYKIIDPMEFGYELVRALTKAGKPVYYWSLEKVRYGDLKDIITSVIDFGLAKSELSKGERVGYFTKPSKQPDTDEDFTRDVEWRYIFHLEDNSKVDKPIIFENIKLLKFCRF